MLPGGGRVIADPGPAIRTDPARKDPASTIRTTPHSVFSSPVHSRRFCFFQSTAIRPDSLSPTDCRMFFLVYSPGQHAVNLFCDNPGNSSPCHAQLTHIGGLSFCISVKRFNFVHILLYIEKICNNWYWYKASF